MTHVLETKALIHRYGESVALDGVDLTVSEGECVALLGPNGAGKTTLVRNIIGLIRADEGTVRVAGGDPQSAATRRKVGVVQQDVGFPRTLTVAEIVEGAAARSGRPKGAATAAMAEMGITDLAGRRAGAISGGQQQRVQLAMGLVTEPALLVLDEPTVGLDVSSRRDFWRTLERRRAEGVGVLVTTHIVEEAAAVADRVVVIDRGRIIAEGAPDELRRRLPDRQITARTRVSADIIRSLDGVETVEIDREVTSITVRDAESVVKTLLDMDADLDQLTVTNASLDDVLIAMTSHTEVAA